MKMQMSTEDMMHIVELLREDVAMGEAALESHSFNKDINKSIEKSRATLLKISSYAVIEAYNNNNDDDDDTNEMEERNRLN